MVSVAEGVAIVAWLMGVGCFAFGLYVFRSKAVKLVMGGFLFKLAASGSVVGALWWIYLGSVVLPVFLAMQGITDGVLDAIRIAGAVAACGAVAAMFYGGYMLLSNVKSMLSE